jgi:hypothetical protein
MALVLPEARLAGLPSRAPQSAHVVYFSFMNSPRKHSGKKTSSRTTNRIQPVWEISSRTSGRSVLPQ